MALTGTGGNQPAERKLGLSKRVLEVCLELGFPISILERSPTVLRALLLLQESRQRARAVMMWSIIYTPDSAHRSTLRQLDRLAPLSDKRFAAMAEFGRAGILSGTCMMPVLPDLCDTDENLEAVVRWTAEHGSQFVLAGGLTLTDQQRDYFLGAPAERFPQMAPRYCTLYPAGGIEDGGAGRGSDREVGIELPGSANNGGETWQKNCKLIRARRVLLGAALAAKGWSGGWSQVWRPQS